MAEVLAADGCEVSFAGARGRTEADLVPEAGYPIELLELSGIDRRNPVKAARALVLAARALPAATRLLDRTKPSVVVGGGGFVAGPVGLAAARKGIPLVLTEADRRLGLANRLLRRRATALCLAFPIEGVEGSGIEVTGRPVERSVIEGDRQAARERFGIAPERRCLLVTGGSLGALSINRAAIEAFGEAASRDFDVIHITGRRDYTEVETRLEQAEDSSGYHLLEYEPNLGDALAASDLALSRSGGSVFELAATGKPAILIPYPYASADHQAANARWMEEAGAAVVLSDGGLTPELIAGSVSGLFGDPGRLEGMSEAAHSLARPDAAERVARTIERSASEGGR
ncbi:MAG: UDP-N-acetylglucosamine--N-acetylmuramyl-(pentapeptide) pyrophosphoryl-undecaprenol N-acetylglucosamine transferase [Solirubrobacterales bacterium]